VLRKLQEDVQRLQKDTLWFELLAERCIIAGEESKSTSSTLMNRMDKSLKNIRRDIESSRCDHDMDTEPLAQLKLTMEHGGALLLSSRLQ
jgi:hypothetical protein